MRNRTAKTEICIGAVRKIIAPGRCAQCHSSIIPTAAANNPGGAGRRTPWVRQRSRGVVVPVVPICHPLAYVSGHVIDTIGAVVIGKGCALAGIPAQIVVICLFVRFIITPRIEEPVRPAGGLFSFRFGWQTFADIGTVIRGILPGDPDHRIVVKNRIGIVEPIGQ